MKRSSCTSCDWFRQHTGEVLENMGALEKIEANLKASGFEVLIFANVEPEPHVEKAEAIFEQFAEESVGLVIGLGGGSRWRGFGSAIPHVNGGYEQFIETFAHCSDVQ